MTVVKLSFSSVQVDTLIGGTRRFRAEGSSFLFRRLKPGVIWVRAEGYDRGQFGEAVVGELSAEVERFSTPAVLFVDARSVPQVQLAAQAVWRCWFERHRQRLSAIHVLVHASGLQLAVSIAQHYARIPLLTHVEASGFEHTLRRAVPGWKSDQAEEAAVVAIKEERSGGRVAITDERCLVEFHSPKPSVLRLRFAGTDDGTLASAVFDKVRWYMDAGGPLELFIDLRDATLPAVQVSELWTAWFTDNRKRLTSVVILSTTRAVLLTVDIVDWRSRTGGLIRLVSDAEAFDRAFVRAVSQPTAPSALMGARIHELSSTRAGAYRTLPPGDR